MKNLTVRYRLGLGFGAVVVLMTLAAGYTADRISRVQEEIKAFSERSLPNTVMAGKFIATVLQTARHTRNMLIYDDAAKVAAEIKAVRETADERAEQLAFLGRNVKAPAALAQLEVVKSAHQTYLPVEANYLKLVESNMLKEAKLFLLETMRPAQLAYINEIEKLVDVQTKAASDAASAAFADAETARYSLFGGVGLVLLLSGLVAWLVTNSVVVPLNRAVEISDRIAQGNLRNTINVDRKDELGTLLLSLDGMQTNLAGLVRQIQANSTELTSASNELAATAEQVSVASNSQSEAAASMAASVEQMTVSVSHITDSAQTASEKTAYATGLSGNGRRVVESAEAEMAGIAEGIRRSAGLVTVLQAQSKEISSIADVIKNIAEQTNLLALNAAIEAARAGEDGRGFAVVADAVRELAERTTASTAEIAGTIDKIQASTDQVFIDMNQSVERATKGLSLSQEAGRAIGELSASADEVLVAVREISSALKEQSQASNDIARHVESIAQMAQENSGAVEQAKDSARSLQGLAATLQGSVTRFSV